MAIHFKADHKQLRPLGRATRGVKSMNLRKGDNIISMDVIPSQVTAAMEEAIEDENLELDVELDAELDIELEQEETDLQTEETEGEEENVAETSSYPGPWALVVTTGGFGKRVPVTQFRLQRRAGKGVCAIKFRNEKDRLAALRIVNEDDELMIVTNRGIIIRQASKAISSQSRSARGVRVQRLDSSDAIAGVALVPASGEEDDLTTDSATEMEMEAGVDVVTASDADNDLIPDDGTEEEN
jgi:DNA gyrase subunit A